MWGVREGEKTQAGEGNRMKRHKPVKEYDKKDTSQGGDMHKKTQAKIQTIKKDNMLKVT